MNGIAVRFKSRTRLEAEVLTWCHANVAAGAWAQHGYMDRKRRDDRGIPIDFTRWYFLSDADAEAFKKRWGVEAMANV